MSRLRKPLVSVVLASYNHAKFVGIAIESVLQQSIKNLELIIVDDGSSDESDKVIRSFKDKRIKYIRLEQNRQFHPRNLGIKNTHGRYIAFQNSDDVWESNKLEQQLEQFKQIKNLSVCFTDVKIISETGKTLSKSWANGLFFKENITSEQWLRRFFDIGNGLCIASAVMKRSTLKKAGLFDESLIQLSDFDLWIRMALQGEFYILNKPLTKMRIIKNSNISAPTPQAHRRSALELAQILERYKSKKINLHLVFPDVINTPDLPTQINQAYLAHYALKKSPAHKLFAQKLYSELFAKTASRNLITSYFGAEVYLEFVEKRSQLELVGHE